MTCTKCGYMMGPFDRECVRCKNGVGAEAAAPVSAPMPVNTSPVQVSLIICPACHQQVSSQALACPKCGQPIAQQTTSSLMGQAAIFSGNGSGTGTTAILPAELSDFNWGAFCISWMWAVGNNTWIGLLSLFPGVGFIMSVILGIKGNEWAWQNRRWESIEQFKQVQKTWAIFGFIALFVMTLLLVPIILFEIGAISSASN